MMQKGEPVETPLGAGLIVNTQIVDEEDAYQVLLFDGTRQWFDGKAVKPWVQDGWVPAPDTEDGKGGEDVIYSLALHEEICFDGTEVLRVPGGWIYTVYASAPDGIASCFVPYSDEFKSKP